MKRIIIVFVAIVTLSLGVMAQTGRLFSSIAKEEGVTSVYAGSSLMEYCSGNLNLLGYGINADAIEKVDVLEIISFDSEVAADFKSLCEQANDIVGKLNLEMLMESHDEDEGKYIYVAKPTDNKEYCERFIIVTYNDEEYRAIHVVGKVHLGKLLGRYTMMMLSI